jgi:integrase
MVATLIYTGLRREELLWLQTDDFVRSTERARNGLLRVSAKTAANQSWQPKTKSNRVVPISGELRPFLDGYMPPKTPDGWLFPSPQLGRWDPDNFSRELRAANRACGLPWSSLHFRHSFGSHLAQRGVSLYQIAALMGNSPSVCQRHYAALVLEDMEPLVSLSAAPPLRAQSVNAPREQAKAAAQSTTTVRV